MIFTALVTSFVIISAWMLMNYKSHSPEWRQEKIMDWVRRPFPKLNLEEQREMINRDYPSENFKNYPYVLIDAIVKPEEPASEVVRWAIYYFGKETGYNYLKDSEWLEANAMARQDVPSQFQTL